ncbi:bacterial Cytochrome Ubiquinol Oxidase family protein [Bordetella holmesii 70147]|nr:bacterial Cytochrome Ubiquinol Oxidase family protein [Bordetella holmesii 70147]
MPDTAAQRNQSALTLSNSGGRWLAQDADAEYIGLDKFSGMSPPVAMVFLALRALWLLGAMMFVAALFSFCLSFRRGYDPAAMPRWWLRMLTGMMFAGGVSVVLGVWVAQIGLQPYIVNRTITQSEVLSAVSASTLWWGWPVTVRYTPCC